MCALEPACNQRRHEHEIVTADLLEKRLHIAIRGQQDAERTAARLEGQLESARVAAKARRIEIGQILTEARPAFPGKGRPRAGAEPWSAFLARAGLDERTAHNYMAEFRDREQFGKRFPNSRAAITPHGRAAAQPRGRRTTRSPPGYVTEATARITTETTSRPRDRGATWPAR